MPGQTLYDVLQVSRTASQETIRASWERLSAQWDPVRPYNNGADARTHYLAIKNAYVTLGNPQKRAVYNQKLRAARRAPVRNSTASLPKVAFALAAVLMIGSYHYIDREQVARIAKTVVASVGTTAQTKQSATAAQAEVTHVAQADHALEGESGRMPQERRAPSEALVLKLDIEFSSGAQLVRTPLSRL